MEQAAHQRFAGITAEVVTLCASTHRNDSRLIHLLQELDGIRPWPGEEADLAHWLAHQGGLDLVTAREKVRVARAMADLPLIAAAFHNGELSYSKVRAITRIAEPDTEGELIDLARAHTAENLVRMVRARRQGEHLSSADAALDAWKHRYVDCHHAGDGSVVFEGRLPAELGAMLMQALERASDELFARNAACDSRDARPPEDADPARQPAQARRADALALLAERYLATAPDAEGCPNHAAAASTTPGCNTADRFLITVHTSAEALCRGGTDTGAGTGAVVTRDPDLPVFEDGSVAAAATVRRLGCDASVVHILENGRGEPLDVGRNTRVIPPAIRRALKSRDGGCRFPGCTHTRFVDGRHITHWADGGATRLDNLVSLCRFHHRLLHEGDYRVVLDGKDFRFFRKHGDEVLALPRKRAESVQAENGFAAAAAWRRPMSLLRPGQPP